MANLFEAYLNTIKGLISGESTAAAPQLSEEITYVEKDLDRELKIEDIKTRNEFNTLLKQNREERKKYAHHIFLFTCIWASVIFVIIVASSLKSINGHKYIEFEISDKVLITLITSTTVNFFGFFLLVVKYLFNTGEKEKKEKEKIKKLKTVKAQKPDANENE